MISMDFLSHRPLRPAMVAGVEFIDFQSEEFYTALSGCLRSYITQTDKGAFLSPDCKDEVLKLIKNYTGFENITLKFLESGNLYVDTGYFAPGHVLNNAGVDALLKPSQSTLYRWFEDSKDKVFKGGVDYSTGKVYGAFTQVPVELGINTKLNSFFPKEKLTKWGADEAGGTAGAMCHELGHVFAGCMMLATALKDNLVGRTALEFYRNAKRTEDRVVVLKDTAELLGMKNAKLDELKEWAKGDGDEMFFLYFTKLTAQRNNQRALSVGVTTMTNEVVADMYAIRMGCGKGIIAAVGSLVDKGGVTVLMESLMYGALITANLFWFPLLMMFYANLAVAALPVMMGALFVVSSTLVYFGRGYSGVYNADHRRMEDALRQLIAQLKESKDLPVTDRTKLVDDIVKLLEMSKSLKPWYDNTVIHRAVGWLFAGGDFKLKEIEHFTQALNNHELVVLSNQLKSLS